MLAVPIVSSTKPQKMPRWIIPARGSLNIFVWTKAYWTRPMRRAGMLSNGVWAGSSSGSEHAKVAGHREGKDEAAPKKIGNTRGVRGNLRERLEHGRLLPTPMIEWPGERFDGVVEKRRDGIERFSSSTCKRRSTDNDDYARSLSIGAETMVMRFRTGPTHAPSAMPWTHGFLAAEAGNEVVTIGRLVNTFSGGKATPARPGPRRRGLSIDYANACPDLALTSLHYYFPWAIKALVKWCVFALVTGQAGPARPGDRPVLRDRRRARRVLRRQAGRPTASWPMPTSRPSATRTSARAAWPTSTRWCWTGWPARLRPVAGRHSPVDLSRRTSTTSSSPTCGA